MCMERFSTMTLRRCYKPSVNESETITDAKLPGPARNRSEPGGRPGAGSGFPAASHIERS